MHKHILDELAEAEQELDALHQSIDRLTKLIHAAGRTGDLTMMRLTYELYQDESEQMNAQSVRINDRFKKLLKEGNMKRSERMIFGAVIILLMVALLVSVVGAQDTPLAPTNTVEAAATLVESTALPELSVTEAVDVVATEEAPVVIINNPPSNPQPTSDQSDRVIYIIGFLLFLVYSGVKDYFATRQTSTLVNTVNKGLDNKLVQDEARERYMQSSMENKEFINLLRAITGFAGSLNLPVVDPALDKANNWLTDVTRPEAPAEPPQVPAIPSPDPWQPQYPADNPSRFT